MVASSFYSLLLILVLPLLIGIHYSSLLVCHWILISYMLVTTIYCHYCFKMVEAFLTAPVVTAKEDVSGPTSLPLRCSTTDCHPNLSVGNIPQQQKSRWVKRTPDDLTQLLVGFDELLAALGPANLTHVNNTIIIDPCACWRKQLLEERQIPGGLGQEHLCLQSDAELCFGKYL